MKKNPAKPARLCAMGAPEAEICKTANALAGLFNRVEIDAPDALLTHAPRRRTWWMRCGSCST